MTHQEAVATLAAERYVLEEMAEADREAFEAHYFACPVCAEDLRAAAAMIRGARAGLADGADAARVATMPVRPLSGGYRSWATSAALPWAAAAALACIASYQALWVVPSLRRDAILALVPFVLHPESRGREATVVIHPGASAVTLAVQINEAPRGADVAYELAAADGRRIASGRAAAPPPGAPLLLLVPAWTLVREMHYILTVRDTASPARSLGEYRFSVSDQ